MANISTDHLRDNNTEQHLNSHPETPFEQFLTSFTQSQEKLFDTLATRIGDMIENNNRKEYEVSSSSKRRKLDSRSPQEVEDLVPNPIQMDQDITELVQDKSDEESTSDSETNDFDESA